MRKELTPQYDPKSVEETVYRKWERSGFFNPDKLPGKRAKSYTITVPPPNVTGSLHMGHALNAVIQDILIRKKRMEGFKTLWLPGTDHAGIATQNVVEKDLRKQGISRHELGREKFLEKVWEWKEKYGHIILGQFKKLGSSMDWSRTRFTMDPDYQKAVEEAFLHYYKKGWIYRAERVVNWCTRCRTSLSDLELEYKEEKVTWYSIKYGPLTIGTVRPETKVGDTAIAVNPKDARYKKYIGKELDVETVLGPRKMKVVGDPSVDMEFGTGAMKVTPAHDIHDFELAEKHGLEVKKVIGPDGKMTELAEKYAGLPVAEARKQITEDLRKKGLIVSEKPYTHNVAVCYRCATVIEPMPSLQWFLKMGELAKMATQSVKSGKIRFHPKRWEKVYFDWLKNIKDWCISRQIWWGHKIPIDGVDDVLDTWFSSALWPFATLSKGKDLKTFYPTQVLSTARDIINLWVTRMVFSGKEFTGKDPFKDVIIHATILTKDGKRMSKSLGTGIDPMDLISRYGADATRFGLIWQAMGNQDIHWSEEHVVAGKKFANKIWNASRFVLSNLHATTYPSTSTSAMSSVPNGSGNISRAKSRDNLKPRPKTLADKRILTQLKKMQKTVSEKIEKYEFGPALHTLYDFFWHQFCDKYLEASKTQLADPKLKESTQHILLHTLATSLKLLHPFMPFVTEEIWCHLHTKDKRMLLVESWPK